MSMLAERRQKQKWTLNPRGKWWAEDSNKIGQRMLEKMGWTKGKGLGINEQGITEFSNTSYKSDTTGMGYNNNFEIWTEHQEKFGSFLQQLNGNQKVSNGDTNLSGQSIEVKSKQSQARVHYKKFTRGKDINKYKSKDLANIFGQKELTEKNPIKVEKSDNICKTEASSFRKDWYGVLTINGGNMADYFKRKLNYNNTSDYLKCSTKLNNDTISSNVTDNQTTESENDQYIGFGFTPKTENTSLSSCGAETVCDTNGSSTKSTKKKKKEFEIDLHITEIDKSDNRKKLKDSDDKSNYAFANPCLGLNSLTETACETNDSSTKKKKKEFEVDALHITEINKHDTKKKLKDSDDKSNYAFDNPCLGLNSSTEAACDTNDSSTKSTKKKKKECQSDSLHITETDKHDTRKKLKDSDDKSNYAFDNPCLGLNNSMEIACDTNESSIKSTKKRKKEFQSHSLHITDTDKQNTRKKLKTETIDNHCKNGFINSGLNLDAKPENCNGKEFEVFRTQFGLENCGLDLTDERNDKKRVTFNDHVMLYEYNINSDKKKKEEITLDKFEVENKKSKKKRKHESSVTPSTNGFVNEALDIQILHEEVKDNELNERRNKKIKKRKICKTSNLETIQESPEKEIIEINDTESEDTLDIIIINNEETDNVNTVAEQKSKKKKKKKKEKEEEKTKDEDITVLHVINKEVDIETEKTRCKKVKKDKESKEEEETTISKKCKKKKKKDKENCKNEKHPTQAEINNEQQGIKMVDKLDSKQQNDYLVGSENKDETIIETFSVPTAKEEEKKESLEKIKHKKKKRKSISKENCSSQIDICAEREISDKENTDTHKEQDSITTKKSTKKEKKDKKSKDKNISEIGDSSNPVNVNIIREDKIENAEFTDTFSIKDKVTDVIDDIINSPWSVKTRMSKKTLITLFHNNAISDFPGANIKNIKGYGIDDECELE